MRKYSKYKPSGIEWIGKIPDHWLVNKFRRVSYMKGRIGWQGLKHSEFSENEKLPYLITGMNFKDGKIRWNEVYHISLERYNEAPEIQLKAGDVLMTKDGTIGKLLFVDYLPGKASLNSHLLLMRPLNNNYDPKYLYYTLQCDYFKSHIELTKTGTTFYGISQEAMGDFKIILPPISEQNEIVVHLDYKNAEIETLISNKKRLIELLKEERTAIINHAVTKGINPKVKLKPSGVEWIGNIPEHWEVKKLRYLFYNLNTKRIPLSAEERGKMLIRKYDYYGASGVIDKVDNFIYNEDLILIGEDGANLITRSKKLAFIASGKYWVNNHAHILKPKSGNMKYYVELLELIDYTIYVTGSAQPKLTQEALMAILVLDPPIEEQNQIAKYIEIKTSEIDNIISKTEKEIELLKEYKTALISEVVTGKVDVREEVLC
jgi:type I restriction enzyme, S subunit